MKIKRRVNPSSNRSLAAGIGIGIAVSVGASLLLTAGLTSLVLNESAKENGTNLYIFAIRALATILGCLVGAGVTGGKYLPVIGGICLGYLIALLAIAIVFFGGTFQKLGIGMLSILIGGIIVCLIKLKPLKSKRPKVRLPK